MKQGYAVPAQDHLEVRMDTTHAPSSSIAFPTMRCHLHPTGLIGHLGGIEGHSYSVVIVRVAAFHLIETGQLI